MPVFGLKMKQLLIIVIILLNAILARGEYVYPIDKAVRVDLNPIIEWGQENDARYYILYLDTNWENVFQNKVEFEGITNLTEIQVYNLGSRLNYYWRVDAVMIRDSYKRGPVWSFETIPEPTTIWLLISGLVFVRRVN